MSIKNTEGIKACLTDQSESELLAYRIKMRFSDPNSEQYKRADSLYSKAVGQGGGYLDGVVFEARSKNEVDVPEEDYTKREVSKRFDEFLKEGRAMMGEQFDVKTPKVGGKLSVTEDRALEDRIRAAQEETKAEARSSAAVLVFVGFIIDKIWELDQKAKAQAIERFTNEIKKGKAIPFNLIDTAYVKKKYNYDQAQP